MLYFFVLEWVLISTLPKTFTKFNEGKRLHSGTNWSVSQTIIWAMICLCHSNEVCSGQQCTFLPVCFVLVPRLCCVIANKLSYRNNCSHVPLNSCLYFTSITGCSVTWVDHSHYHQLSGIITTVSMTMKVSFEHLWNISNSHKTLHTHQRCAPVGHYTLLHYIFNYMSKQKTLISLFTAMYLYFIAATCI